MLWVEKGGTTQLKDELVAYNPLIPSGSELVFSFMLEYPHKEKRAQQLTALTGIENNILLKLKDGVTVSTQNANPELADSMVDGKGKTSSVHYLAFKFSESEKKKFMESDSITFQIDHPKYNHGATLDQETIDSLRKDLF